MASVTIVLVATFSIICALTYQQSVNRVYTALNAAVEQGSSPAQNEEGTPGIDLPFEIGGNTGPGKNNAIIPVAVYQLTEDGSLVLSSPVATVLIADEVLAEAGLIVSQSEADSGAISSLGLFFVKRTSELGTYVAFADYSNVEEWRSLALTLGGVGAAALLVFLLISILFARWALKPVRSAWIQQQQFVADASHELKTPITVILASLSILKRHPEQSLSSQSQWVDAIETEATSMQKLVGDMLLLAAPTHSSKVVHSQAAQTVDLSDIVERQLLQFEPVSYERSIETTSELEEHISVAGDAARLECLVSTLLDNAYKYAGAGGRVSVTLTKKRHAELSVSNSGIPISPEDLPHVFDRFYRGDKARERRTGGYGLGLAIAKEIATEHDGSISVRSTEAEGTVFTVTLPLV